MIKSKILNYIKFYKYNRIFKKIINKSYEYNILCYNNILDNNLKNYLNIFPSNFLNKYFNFYLNKKIKLINFYFDNKNIQKHINFLKNSILYIILNSNNNNYYYLNSNFKIKNKNYFNNLISYLKYIQNYIYILNINKIINKK